MILHLYLPKWKTDLRFLEVNHKPRGREFWVGIKLTENRTEVALKVIKDGFFAACIYATFKHELKNQLVPVVQKVDSTIHWINLCPLGSAIIGFPNIYPLDSDLSGPGCLKLG